MRLLGVWPSGPAGVALSVIIGGALLAVGLVKGAPLALVLGAFVLLRGAYDALNSGRGANRRDHR